MKQVKVTHFLEDGTEEVSYVDVGNTPKNETKLRKSKKKDNDKDNS